MTTYFSVSFNSLARGLRQRSNIQQFRRRTVYLVYTARSVRIEAFVRLFPVLPTAWLILNRLHGHVDLNIAGRKQNKNIMVFLPC